MAGQSRFTIQWTAAAELDLTSILDYVAMADVNTALSIFQKIRKSASSLRRLASRGRIVPELQEQGVELYRELIIGPWRIVYRILDKTVFVLAVIDSRRNVEDLLLERFMRPE